MHAGTVDFAKQSKQRVRIAAASMDAATMDKQVKMTEEAKKKQRAAEKQAVKKILALSAWQSLSYEDDGG